MNATQRCDPPISTRDDRGLIVEALNKIALALDERDWEALRRLIEPEVEGYGQCGVEAVIDIVRAHLGGCGPSQHLLGNHLVHIAGDRATTTTYARVFHQGAGDRADQCFECSGTYHDSWARNEHAWLLRSRRFDMTITRGDFDVVQPG